MSTIRIYGHTNLAIFQYSKSVWQFFYSQKVQIYVFIKFNFIDHDHIFRLIFYLNRLAFYWNIQQNWGLEPQTSWFTKSSPWEKVEFSIEGQFNKIKISALNYHYWSCKQCTICLGRYIQTFNLSKDYLSIDIHWYKTNSLIMEFEYRLENGKQTQTFL